MRVFLEKEVSANAPSFGMKQLAIQVNRSRATVGDRKNAEYPLEKLFLFFKWEGKPVASE